MLIAILLIAVTFLAMFLIPKYGAYKCSKILRCCNGVHYSDSSRRGYSSIVGSMERLHPRKNDRYGFTDYEKMDRYMIGDICRDDASEGVRSFIRLCHMAGIEIVIRPVNQELKDLERDPEETRKRLRILRKKYRRAHGLKP